MRSSLPRIGVVVLNWNGRELLEPCLHSLLRSDHPDYRVVVVDNASRDGSVEWMRETFPSGDERPIELLALPDNLRFAGGNNAGAEVVLRAGAEVVLLLNNDTVVESDTLSRLCEPFVQGRADVAGPRICYRATPDRIWYGGGVWQPWWGVVRHRALRQRVDAGHDPAGETDWVTGCALAVRADLWSRLEGLDESYYIYAEDVDFCRRAREAGARIEYVPASCVLHEVSASMGGYVSPFKVYHKTRGLLRLTRRHARPWHWPTLGPSLVFRTLATGVWSALRGGPASGWAAIRAWIDAVRGHDGHPVPSATPLGDRERAQ